MQPYYADDTVKLYHGDCLDDSGPMPWLGADVLITDPPYGLQAMARTYGRHGATIAGDLDTTARDKVLALWWDRPAAVFGSPRLPDPPGEWTWRLVWDKCEPGTNGGPWRYSHESIYVRGTGWTRTSASSFSVIRVPTRNGGAGRQEHPHRKPLEVMTRLVAAAPPGIIADPFCGSGSTLVAAKMLGRHAIGVELIEAHCETSARRLAQDALDFGDAS